jgi:hypothetical protein
LINTGVRMTITKRTSVEHDVERRTPLPRCCADTESWKQMMDTRAMAEVEYTDLVDGPIATRFKGTSRNSIHLGRLKSKCWR